MIRSFIAIKIVPNKEFVRAFQVLKSQLANEKINWVEIENLHLTLRFLGNVSEENIKTLKSELTKIKSISTFDFQIEGIHLFKDIRTPRIIYSEIKAGQELYSLSEEIDNCLLKLGLLSVDKKFLPHLTLGRIKLLKGKENLELVLHEFRKVYFQKAECSDFHLFESILTPSEPIYKVLGSYKLL
jgi:RNA 2',3'-cyclic 3'-phosphodiesterase